METKQIAPLLGISIQMVNKLKRRGMPCDSLESAIEWRRQNLDVTQTRSWRIDGNSGRKRTMVKKESSDTDLIRQAITETLTYTVPRIWFDKIGVLAAITADHGVKISAELFLEIQQCSFLMYAHFADEYLQSDAAYTIPDVMLMKPGSEGYASLIEQLNKILSKPKGYASDKVQQKCR